MNAPFRLHVLAGLALCVACATAQTVDAPVRAPEPMQPGMAAPVGAPAEPVPGGDHPAVGPRPLPPGMPPMPPSEPVDYVAGIEVGDGPVRTGAGGVQLRGPQVTASHARGVNLTSSADRVNGLLVQGHRRFTLSDATLALSGQGKSDFDGIAAGALSRESAQLTLRKVRITTRGVVSTAVTATDQSTLHVHGSTLMAMGGALPSGYTRRIGPGMMEPPTPLGIVGTARAVLVMGEAKAYFHDTTITADGWGALSTDAARGAYLEANNCDVRVLRSGYGVYADHGATVVVNRSRFNVATFGGVIAGEARIAFNDLHSVSAGNTVMIHSVMGRGTEVARLAITGGDLQSTNAAILVKSANANIVVERAKIQASNGDILLGVVNDDSHASKAEKGVDVPGIHATFKDTRLNGNILHLDPDRRMTVHLERTQLKGVVRDVALSLDAHSRWTATGPSRALLTGLVNIRQIDAPSGVVIEARAVPELQLKGSYPLASGGLLKVE
jgi:hypothetical protein